MSASGSQRRGFGFQFPGFGFQVPVLNSRDSGSGFQGFRFLISGFRVSVSGFRESGSGFRGVGARLTHELVKRLEEEVDEGALRAPHGRRPQEPPRVLLEPSCLVGG